MIIQCHPGGWEVAARDPHADQSRLAKAGWRAEETHFFRQACIQPRKQILAWNGSRGQARRHQLGVEQSVPTSQGLVIWFAHRYSIIIFNPGV